MIWGSEVTNTKMVKNIMSLCACRFERMSDPCKGCIYRNRWAQKDDYQTCIFDNCPRDWDIDQRD